MQDLISGIVRGFVAAVQVRDQLSKYEKMRFNPGNWTLGFIYYCAEDPRLIVRQRSTVGWTWNFAHPKVYITILVAISVFLSPPFIAWYLGVRSIFVLALVTVLALIAIMIAASRASPDPGL